MLVLLFHVHFGLLFRLPGPVFRDVLCVRVAVIVPIDVPIPTLRFGELAARQPQVHPGGASSTSSMDPSSTFRCEALKPCMPIVGSFREFEHQLFEHREVQETQHRTEQQHISWRLTLPSTSPQSSLRRVTDSQPVRKKCHPQPGALSQ